MNILIVICVIVLIIVVATQMRKPEQKTVGSFKTETFVHEGKALVVLKKSKYISGLLDIPSEVTNIGYAAFKGMNEITEVVIHEKVRGIADECFEGCSKISQIYTGEGTELIGERAFGGCVALEKIKIGPRVTEIRSEAFINCQNINTIAIECTSVPKAFSSTFDDSVKDNCTLIVPKGCIDVYSAAPGWNKFKNITEV